RLSPTRTLTMVAADSIRDMPDPVRPQQVRQLALDPLHQTRPVEHQRRVDLHQRGSGLDLGIGVGATGNSATADEGYTAFRQAVKRRKAGGCRLEQGGARKAAGLVLLGTLQEGRPFDGGVSDDQAVDAGL